MNHPFPKKPFISESSKTLISVLLLFALVSCGQKGELKEASSALPQKETFSVLIAGTKVGELKVQRDQQALEIDYDYKSNGRGPTIKETLEVNPEGYPLKWNVSGNTTFGNQVDENYEFTGGQAQWKDATGVGYSSTTNPMLYIDQFASPYSLFINAHVLLKSKDMTASALPAGQLKMTLMESFKTSSGKKLKLKSYAMTGAGLNPSYFVLDENNLMFAVISPRFVIVRSGHESEDEPLRQMAEKFSAQRFETLQSQFAHNYNAPIRIQNVKIFDPNALALSDSVSVVVENEKITAIESADAQPKDNEVVIDGNGGTLVAGLYDMHAHMGVNAALLNVIAGVTSVRDMGNNNEVLSGLIDKIENGALAGPRITRMGMIEGKSPFNNNSGVLVESLEQALKEVQNYADQGFYGVKLYNSMKGEWAPEIIQKAKQLNLHVAGHVPAFSNANQMLNAGYDEMTHINQIMLGWVLEPEEDTRTLLRLTALQRLPELDLNSDKVQHTIDLMVEKGAALDPTLAIHEALLLSRNGETQRGVLDYIKNMPTNVQRSAKVAWASIANDNEDQAYRQAYEQIVATLKKMKEAGIFIVPGTDLGGALNLHRELELYKELGYSNAELLKLGSYDMAKYLGHSDRGSIEVGKLADFFLIPGDPVEDFKAIKTISMVSRGGVIYYPSEVYPEFGITPFVEMPEVTFQK